MTTNLTRGPQRSLSFGASLRLGMVTAAALVMAGCPTKVTVPENDPTPPTIRLAIQGFGEDIVLTEDSENVNYAGWVSLTKALALTATAEDPDGGVKRVAVYVDSVRRCLGPEDAPERVGAISYLHGPSDENLSTAGPGDEASTIRVAAVTFRLGDYDGCPRGMTFEELSGPVYALAENFSGEVVQAATFNFSIRASR